MQTSNITIEQVTLPEGFTVRAVQMSDLEPVVDMINASAEQEGHRERRSYDTFRTEWAQPNFDLATQTRLVLSPEGKPVAHIKVYHETDTQPILWHRVHADYHATPVGLYLLQWAERFARDRIHRAPEGTQVALHAASRPNDIATEKRFEALGMEKIRNFYDMRIDMTEAPDVPTMPDGFSIRDYRHPEDLREALRMDIEAFRDHWGFVEPDFEKELAFVKHKYDTDTLFDPELCLLAIDDATGKIVGVCLSRIEAWEDPTVGYVESLAVLREYRGRGLAGTMLRTVFGRFYAKGKPSVTLGVDADSLTGATRLYERAGMYVYEVHPRWQKILREGVDTMTTNLNE
ncbi:MAG: GNAT family N-acetyltransferase [Chloroflexota bacterium]